ncbi:MAG TPA: NAD(P)-binding domain-containing protein [Pirellulaceae bacterium]|nr:NAD(P)-binding domain-containing protein [Pirellulaceae bacterium]
MSSWATIRCCRSTAGIGRPAASLAARCWASCDQSTSERGAKSRRRENFQPRKLDDETTRGATRDERQAMKTVGLIGLGLVGAAVARRWTAQGWTVVGYDVNAERRSEFHALGGESVGGPADVARRCRTVVLSLPDSQIVARVVTEFEDKLRAGDLVIDMTTGRPEDTLALAERLERRGARVSSGRPVDRKTLSRWPSDWNAAAQSSSTRRSSDRANRSPMAPRSCSPAGQATPSRPASR